MILSGPANSTFNTENRVHVDLKVDGEVYAIEIHSIPGSAIMCDTVIGRILFQTSAELHVKPDEVRIFRSEAVQKLMAINVDSTKLDIGKKTILWNN